MIVGGVAGCGTEILVGNPRSVGTDEQAGTNLGLAFKPPRRDDALLLQREVRWNVKIRGLRSGSDGELDDPINTESA